MLAELKQFLVIITLTYIVPTLYQLLDSWDLWYVLSVNGPHDMDHKLSSPPPRDQVTCSYTYVNIRCCVAIHVRPVERQVNTGTKFSFMSRHGLTRGMLQVTRWLKHKL